MSITIPSRLIDRLLEGNGRVLFFVGAGCSMDPPSSLPSAYQLAQQIIKPRLVGTMAKKVDQAETQSGDRLSVEDIAELFYQEDKCLDRFFALLPRREWLARQHHEGHLVIAHLWSEGLVGDLITTNVDVLLEAGFGAMGVGASCYTQAEHFTKRPDPPRVFKIHGCLNDESTMVWAKSQLESEEWRSQWARILMEHELLSCGTIVYLGYATTLKYLGRILEQSENRPESFIVNPTPWAGLHQKAPDFLAKAGISPDHHIQAGAKEFLLELERAITIELVGHVFRAPVRTLLGKLGLGEESEVEVATKRLAEAIQAISPEKLQGMLGKMMPCLPVTQKYVPLRKTEDFHRLMRLLTLVEWGGLGVGVGDNEAGLTVAFPGGRQAPLWAISVDGDTPPGPECLKWLKRFHHDEEFRKSVGCGNATEVVVAVSGGTGEVRQTSYFDICRGTNPGGLRHRVPKVKWLVDQQLHSLLDRDDLPASKEQLSKYIDQQTASGGDQSVN